MVARLLFAPLLRHRSSSPPSTLPSRLISTLVVAEQEGGLIRPSSLSALAAAGSIGHDNSISVLLAGTGSSLHKAVSQAAGLPTVSQVLVADSEFFERPTAEPLAELVRTVHQRGKYSHIVAASNSFGKNMLPRAAALLDVSPITDVIEIHEPQLFIRPIYAGNALCTVRYTGSDPCMLSVRPTSFSPILASIDQKPQSSPISQVDLSTFSEGATKKSNWLSHSSQDAERPDLVNARVVVTGGRGLKSAENFKLLEKLAEKLGAAERVANFLFIL